MASPWALDFSAREQPMANALSVGVAVLALAAWTWLASKERGVPQTGPTGVTH